MLKKKRDFCTCMILIAGLSATPVVVAQDSSALQEIVVTAQKRTSTVLETPISITAVGGDDIQQRGITDFADLAATVPGISMRTNGPGQTEFEMRGVTSSGGNSPTVGFYLDDAPLTAPAAAQNGKVVISPSLYDLDRVEVLRGPQGTLYGSGSMGGTIKLVTNQPNLHEYQTSAEAIVSGTDGGGLNHGENAMLNLPLMDGVLALRLVASNEFTSGWISRIVVNDFPLETNGGSTRGNVLGSPVLQDYKGANAERRDTVRLALLWKPIDGLSITPSVFYQMDQQAGPSTYDSEPGTLAHYEPFLETEPSLDRFTLLNLNANYDAKLFDVTSVTSKWLRESVLYQDASEATQYTFDVPAFYPSQGGLGATAFKEDDPSHQWSEEIRIASKDTQSLNWLLGGFYQDFGSSWNVFQNIAALPAVFGSPTSSLFTFYQPTTIKQKAVFGEATYAAIDQLKITAGLRWFQYDASFTEYSAGFGGPTGSDTPFLTGGKQTANGVDPKFNVSYMPNQDQMIYATVAKGFRPGGPNQPIPNNPDTLTGAACLASLEKLGLTAAPSAFQPDKLWSYEVGEKSRLWNSRLDLNGAAYYETWSGIQQQKYLSCGFPFTDNAGKARVYGAELEVHAAVAPGFVISASGAYTNAKTTENVQVTGTIAGQPLPDIPTWTGNLRLSYDKALPFADQYRFLARLENTYTGAREDATYTPITPLPPIDLTNARMGLSTGSWTAWIFVDNVFNKQGALENATALSFYVPTYNRVLTNQPLTAGVDLNVRF